MCRNVLWTVTQKSRHTEVLIVQSGTVLWHRQAVIEGDHDE